MINMDAHRQKLQCFCRLCGENKPSSDLMKLDDKRIRDVKLALNVDLKLDDEDVHPPNIGGSCRNKLKRWRDNKNNRRPCNISINVKTWHCHNGYECEICYPSQMSPAEAAKETARQLRIISWEEGGSVVFVKWTRGGLKVERHVIINSDNSWTVTVCGNDLSEAPIFSDIPKNLETAVQACMLVAETFSRNLCMGLLGFDDIVEGKSVITGVKKEIKFTVGEVPNLNHSIPTATSVTVRYANCDWLMDSDRTSTACAKCIMMRSTLCSKRTSKRTIINENLPSSKCRNDYLAENNLLQEKLNSTQKERQKLQVQNRTLREKIKTLYEREAVELEDDEQEELVEQAFVGCESELLKEVGENEAFKLMYEEQQKIFKAKDKRQMRWHPAIIRFCIAIYNKSSSTYNLIRNSPFLKLPHKSTLKKYMSFTTPQVGVNPEVLNFISTDWKLDELEQYKCNVTLVFDEIKLKSDLAYSKTSGKLIGYTDLGPISNELEQFESRLNAAQESEDTEPEGTSSTQSDNNTKQPMQPQIATQMLVLMARGIFSSLRIPVAYFPTTNAKSHQLYHCIWPTVKAISLLGLTVRAFVADGASWNRKFFTHHTLVRSSTTTTYYTKHPFLRNERLYFICDVPHLIKTTRNNWENSGWNMKSRNLHYNHQDIKWTHLVDLWKWDKGDNRSSPGFRMMSKVHEAHVKLDPSLRMKVSLAAQVLSKTVADCFQAQTQLEGTYYTKSTQYFIRMMDKFFDCLNVKTPYQWIHKRKENLKPYKDVNDERFKWLLDEFLPWLDEWEREAMATPGLTTAEKKKLCLSEQTLEGLRITVYSFVELTQDLLRQPGVEYVCSDKLNQDVLEEWFSLARGAGGSNKNPTAKELGDIHLNLLVAGSNAVASTRGNSRNQKREINLDSTKLPMKKVKRSSLP